MKRVMIHTPSIGGHQLEYLHHLYLGAIRQTDNQYFFVVPQRFLADSQKLEWPTAKNIQMIIMEEDEEPSRNCGLIKKSYINSRTIQKYSSLYGVTDIFVISIMEYLPLIPLFVNRRIRIKGIVYRIYLYEWKEESRRKRILDVLKYIIMTWFSVFEQVFILNDDSAAHYLNKLYHTNKYSFLPDPVASITLGDLYDIRKKYGISKDKILVLHPGGMLPYKGTINILKAIEMMEKNELDRYTFIFAGQVTESIKDDFYRLYELLKNKCDIIVEDDFVSFNFLSSCFIASNLVLAPYSVKSQSSGIIGHSALYKKPVVVINHGVIGKLVKKYRLGYLLKEPTALCIKDFLVHYLGNKYNAKPYITDNSVDAFVDGIGL